MKVEMDTDRLNEIGKDLREVAKKHKASIMELAQACIGVVSHQYYLEKTFPLPDTSEGSN